MIVRRRDIALELWDIAKTNGTEIPSPFINQVVNHLKKEGELTLKSNLSKLINTRLSNESDAAMYSQESSVEEEIDNGSLEIQSDDELIEMVSDIFKKEKDPEFSVLRSYSDEINEILYKYARRIAPHKSYLPVKEWDLASLSFYCMLWGYDPTLEDLLFPIFSFSKQNEHTSFNFERFVTVINELHTGSNDAETVIDLTHEKNLEDNQKEYDGELANRIRPSAELSNSSRNNKSEKVENAPTPNTSTYFELNADYSKLRTFRTELEHLGYIDRNVPTESFRRIFLFQKDPLMDKLKQQTNKPIEWLNNKSHLGYLIKQLSKNNIITGKEYYKIAENCFLFKGEPISNTVFHGMQLPSEPAKRKIAKIVALLK